MSLKRLQTNKRMSQVVIHGNTVYTAGQVALTAPGESVKKQTEVVLAQISQLLAEAGSDKSQLISATIWLACMDDFAEMNAVWDAWVIADETPVRACVESKLASPDFSVEIAVIAARD